MGVSIYIPQSAESPLFRAKSADSDNSRVVDLFVTEMLGEDCCYWHLTAISPAFQGIGYGKWVWREMLHFHQPLHWLHDA